MREIEEFCPAKVNLFLAVTGRRPDGFHELVSVMAPLNLGDRLRLRLKKEEGVSFSCDDERLPCDEGNLVLRAVTAFRERYPFREGLRIELEKRIPAGAGLGGGSSDAARLLVGLNQLLGHPADRDSLHELALSIGSDCPFFVDCRSAVVRGRGERIEPLPEVVRKRLNGAKILLIKPSFPIATAWAYGALAKEPNGYCPPERAENFLAEWEREEEPVRELLFNSLERPVYRKFIPLPALKERLEKELGLAVLMSGSGSTLFALLGGDQRGAEAIARARDALGADAWIAETRICESC